MKNKTLIFLTSAFAALAFLAGCNNNEGRRCEVTFMNYNQDVLFYNTVPYGGTAVYQGEAPTRPREGQTTYYFSGWDKPLENIKKDTTFIAQYTTTATLFDITWLNFDGSFLSTTTVEYGATPVYAGLTPTKPSTEEYDYVFTGWTPEVVPAVESTSYTAVFEQKERQEDKQNVQLSFIYTIYNPKTGEPISSNKEVPPGLGSVSQSSEYKKGSNIDLYVSPREGYTFVGWYYEGHLLSQQKNYKFKIWDEDVELEVRFQYTQYTLYMWSYNTSLGYVALGDNGYTSSVNTHCYFTEKLTLYAYTGTDYRFLGWYTPDNELMSNNAAYEFSMPNHNLELIAKWNRFTITYYLNGGSVSTSLVYEYSYLEGSDSSTRFIELPTPKKTGYNFSQWELTEDSTSVTRLDKSLLRDYSVRAMYNPIEYTIVYMGNDETGGQTSSQTMTYDYQYSIRECGFYKTGYTFSSWNTKANGSGTQYNPGQSVTNLTTVEDKVIYLYAIWTPKNYNVTLRYTYPLAGDSATVSFETNGANEYVEVQYIDASNTLVYPGVLTKTGYAFKGWYKDSECTELFDFSSAVTEDITLYAGWVAMVTSSYNTRYYVDATQYNSSSNAYSASQSGTSSSYSNYYYFTALTSGTISFNYKTSSEYSSYYYIYYYIVNATAGTSIDSGTVYNSFYANTAFSVTAGNVYYIRTYRYSTSYSPTLSFYFAGVSAPADGGGITSYYSTVQVAYDSSYKLPGNLTQTGYTFVGWFDEDGVQYTDEYGYSLEDWTLDDELVLYTHWTANTYDIYYYLNSGTNSDENPTTYTIEDNVTLIAPTRTGYDFAGWYLNDTTPITEISRGKYTGALYLYAHWTAKSYTVTLIVSDLEFNRSCTVTFETNGANETISSQVITKSTGLTYPGVVTKSGYAFTGWYLDSECTELYDFTEDIDEDITIYAGWRAMNVSNYYNRYYVDSTKYNSGSVYSSSQSGTSSSSYNYYFFTALTTGTAYIYYATSSTSSYYRIYMYIYNATTNSTIFSNSYISNSSYSSTSFSAVAGNVYYIRTYRYNTSYSPTFYFYFSGLSKPAAGGKSTGTTTTYMTTTVHYNDYVCFTPNFTRDGYRFVGWFDEDGVQYTDEYGYLLDYFWVYDYDVTLYAHWEVEM